MEKQITKLEALKMAVAVVEEVVKNNTFSNTELAEKIDIELLEKLQAMSEQQEKEDSRKREKKTKSKTSLEKEKDIDLVKDFYSSLENKEVFLHGGEIIEAIETFNDYTSQKITSRLSQMVKDGFLEKGKATSDKKKTGYKLV